MSTLKVNTLQNTSGNTLNFVRQVVSATTSTEVIVASTTFTDTTLTASITPSSTSSKILVLICQSYFYSSSSTAHGMGLKIFRGSTVILDPLADSTGPYSYYTNTSGSYGKASYSLLDSPSTTSSVTYKTQGRPYTTANSGTARFQFNDSSGTKATSFIQLLEIAA